MGKQVSRRLTRMKMKSDLRPGPALLATALIAIHASGAYAAVQKTKLQLFPLLPP